MLTGAHSHACAMYTRVHTHMHILTRLLHTHTCVPLPRPGVLPQQGWWCREGPSRGCTGGRGRRLLRTPCGAPGTWGFQRVQQPPQRPEPGQVCKEASLSPPGEPGLVVQVGLQGLSCLCCPRATARQGWGREQLAWLQVSCCAQLWKLPCRVEGVWEAWWRPAWGPAMGKPGGGALPGGAARGGLTLVSPGSPLCTWRHDRVPLAAVLLTWRLTAPPHHGAGRGLAPWELQVCAWPQGTPWATAFPGAQMGRAQITPATCTQPSGFPGLAAPAVLLFSFSFQQGSLGPCDTVWPWAATEI